jgi:hypothetical protein
VDFNLIRQEAYKWQIKKKDAQFQYQDQVALSRMRPAT